MPYIEVAPDIRLSYEDFGDGPPIVFTHAGLTTHKMWDHQVAALAARFRTVAYDWRGVGASDKPRGSYSVDTLVADLSALITGLNLGRATLVGHGVGTHVALLATAIHPELVARLVLVSGAPWFKGDREAEGGFSLEFTEWFNAQMAGLLAPQASASLYERFMFHRDPGAGRGPVDSRDGARHAAVRLQLIQPQHG
jgi:pimeloyl-ACP methyl ester carboxylesterase